MKLHLKGITEKGDEIELVRSFGGVKVMINGESVATFCDDGRVRYFGKGCVTLYEGTWE